MSHLSRHAGERERWDYDYSIGRLRPDLILQLSGATAEDFALINRLGYEQPLRDLFVRGDSTNVDRIKLRNAGCEFRLRQCLSPVSPANARS